MSVGKIEFDLGFFPTRKPLRLAPRVCKEAKKCLVKKAVNLLFIKPSGT
jgi:hypothetical protein